MSGAWDRLVGAGLAVVLRALALLPPHAAREACARFAALYAAFDGPRVADARTNLEIALPERTAPERERILIESFANLGRSFAEIASMRRPDAAACFDRVVIEGRENLERARAESGAEGALILTAHFGSWEFCAAALAHHGLPVSVVQHPFVNPAVDRIVTGWRKRAGLETLPMGRAALGIFRALARGRYIALLLDQNASEEEGVYAPFFGRAACTRSGPAQLAMTRGAPVVPVFFYRRGTTGAHVARIGQPIAIEPEADDAQKSLVANVERMNAAIEAAIRTAPDQWTWSHRRFKTQPEGAPPVYPRRRGVFRSLRRALRGAG